MGPGPGTWRPDLPAGRKLDSVLHKVVNLWSPETLRLGDFLPPLLQGDLSTGRTPLRGSILSTVSLIWFSLKRLG